MNKPNEKTISRTSTRAVALALTCALAVACGEDTNGPANTPGHTASISECGGFAAARSERALGDLGYCDAETLEWSYDAQQQQLTLRNYRVLLNCCGEHSVDVKLGDDGTYLVSERDAPEFGDARCDCLCVFDFAVEIDGVPAGAVKVELTRNVTDDGQGPQQIFAGELDLGQTAGVEVIDDTSVDPWCQEPNPSGPPATTRISSCGGFDAERGKADNFDSGAEGYCDAEVLDWRYDAESGQLSVEDRRVKLKCCGEHAIKLALEGGALQMTEIDAPEAQTGSRCNCICPFDFGAQLPLPAAAGTIDFTLVREVTDSGEGAVTLYSGKLDLGAGSGQLVIDDQPAVMCNM